MDKGTVEGVNLRVGRIAIRCDTGFVLAELQSGEAELGDEIHGELNSHGSHFWRNKTSGNMLEVYVEAIQAGHAQMLRFFMA